MAPMGVWGSGGVENDEKKTREALKYSPGEESFDAFGACHAFTFPTGHVRRTTRLPTGTTPTCGPRFRFGANGTRARRPAAGGANSPKARNLHPADAALDATEGRVHGRVMTPKIISRSCTKYAFLDPPDPNAPRGSARLRLLSSNSKSTTCRRVTQWSCAGSGTSVPSTCCARRTSGGGRAGRRPRSPAPSCMDFRSHRGASPTSSPTLVWPPSRTRSEERPARAGRKIFGANGCYKTKTKPKLTMRQLVRLAPMVQRPHGLHCVAVGQRLARGHGSANGVGVAKV